MIGTLEIAPNRDIAFAIKCTKMISKRLFGLTCVRVLGWQTLVRNESEGVLVALR